MSGVFLSYSRNDEAIGRQVIRGLRSLGIDCWWDEDLPGVPWQEELERQINSLSALVVIWSQASRNSKFVRAEAALALSSDKLVNVLVGVPQPPFPFNGINGLPLDGWTGREPHSGWTRLIKTIEDRLVQAGGAEPGALMAALARHEHDVRTTQKALSEAEEAFADAKAADGDTDQALQDARATLTAAEDQLGRVSEMRASPNVIRGAQADFDEARAALREVEAAHRARAAELVAASRALSRAKVALDEMFGEPVDKAVSTEPSVAAPESFLEPERPPQPRPERPAASTANPLTVPWGLIAVGGAVAAVALIGFVALSPRSPKPVPATSSGADRIVVATSAVTAPDPAVLAARALVGDWSGNGAVCGSNPLHITFDETSRTVSETVSDTPTAGALAGAAADGAVELRFASDGHTERDTVQGDRLTLRFSGGSMTYERCKT
jgi:hypothetical protein